MRTSVQISPIAYVFIARFRFGGRDGDTDTGDLVISDLQTSLVPPRLSRSDPGWRKSLLGRQDGVHLQPNRHRDQCSFFRVYQWDESDSVSHTGSHLVH